MVSPCEHTAWHTLWNVANNLGQPVHSSSYLQCTGATILKFVFVYHPQAFENVVFITYMPKWYTV